MVLDFNTLYTFPGRMDRFIEEFFRPEFDDSKRLGYPPVNLSEDEENIYVRSEIPGVEMADIELTLTDKNLVLKGERKPEEGKFFRQERPSGMFQRIVSLNVPVDRDKVSAVMRDGVLTVTLPKSEESKPRTISIGVS